MNIEAPIVSGESAAGIQIGSPIEEVLKEDKHSFDSGEREKPWFPTLVKIRYRSAMVDLWAGIRTTRSVSTFTLNQRALQELIILLEQHSYEAFVKGLKHGPAISM
ncbi:MAG: hypothetical protein ACXVCM_15340 [Ktedonobacteraceae bacterium]